MKKIVNAVNRSPMGICTQYQKPRQFAALAAHRIKYKYAEELAAEIVPKMGERYYCIVNGTFVFGDFIEAFVVQNNWLVKNLSISTLGYNQNNVDSFENLIDGDFVQKLSIIASAEFYGFERAKDRLIPYTYEKLNTGKIDFQLSFADTHMKIINIETECGIFVTIHGSANLRSSGNIEQFAVDFDRDIYDINQEVFDKILEQTKTIKTPIRGKALWSVIE